jgi:ParB/RepB/Spo0J family partition protein
MRFFNVPTKDIEADSSWNTRLPTETPLAEGEVDADEALRASIAQSGLLQPLGVRRNLDGSLKPWRLVFGFRRFAAAELLGLETVPCREVDTENARVANLTENFARQNLTPGELMEALGKLQAEHPKMTTEEMGKAVGRTSKYVANLLRLRRKLAPELLEAFRERGSTMHYHYLVQVCTLSHADQARRYSEMVTGSRGGRPEGSLNGTAPVRGLAEEKHLKRWLKDARASLKNESDVERAAWLRGASHAIGAALGQHAFALVDEAESTA